MKCGTCAQKNYPPKGSPAPGYCDACGWALGATGDTIKPAKAQVVVGQALILEAHNKIGTGDALANLRRTLFL